MSWLWNHQLLSFLAGTNHCWADIIQSRHLPDCLFEFVFDGRRATYSLPQWGHNHLFLLLRSEIVANFRTWVLDKLFVYSVLLHNPILNNSHFIVVFFKPGVVYWHYYGYFFLLLLLTQHFFNSGLVFFLQVIKWSVEYVNLSVGA